MAELLTYQNRIALEVTSGVRALNNIIETLGTAADNRREGEDAEFMTFDEDTLRKLQTKAQEIKQRFSIAKQCAKVVDEEMQQKLKTCLENIHSVENNIAKITQLHRQSESKATVATTELFRVALESLHGLKDILAVSELVEEAEIDLAKAKDTPWVYGSKAGPFGVLVGYFVGKDREKAAKQKARMAEDLAVGELNRSVALLAKGLQNGAELWKHAALLGTYEDRKRALNDQMAQIRKELKEATTLKTKVQYSLIVFTLTMSKAAVLKREANGKPFLGLLVRSLKDLAEYLQNETLKDSCEELTRGMTDLSLNTPMLKFLDALPESSSLVS